LGQKGNDYQIRVQSISQPSITDECNDFTITMAATPCFITISSLNGGQTWKRGTFHAVT